MISAFPRLTPNKTKILRMTGRIEPVIAQFAPISLAEMDSVALLDRMETKYLLGVSQLSAVLARLTRSYRVLEINGVRLNRYQTVYFDTPDFTLYQQHHNGFGTRYKVRARQYVDSALAFFEVKHKTNRERTLKSRLPIPEIVTDIPTQLDDFVSACTPYHAAMLEPKLWNDYMRLTLVSIQHQERLTLDLNVGFHWGAAAHALPGLAIAEVKQDHCSQNSAFIHEMKRLGVQPAGFSKYTAGVYSLYDGVKLNNFKPQIRHVSKIMQEELNHEFVH